MRVDLAPDAEQEQLISRDASTGEQIATFAVHGRSQVDDAVARADSAAELWSSAGFVVRRKAMINWAREIVARADELVSLVQRENGKPTDDAYMELVIAVEHIRWAAHNAERILRTRSVLPGVLMANYSAEITHEPFGVIGVISPWNYPLFAPVAPIASALAAGNTVVLKPSEFATATADVLIDCFRRANSSLPRVEGVLELVTGTGQTGAALVESAVDKIEFTGSPGTGRRILESCSHSMKPVVMECGGKDVLIVAADADVDAAAEAAAWGGYSNGGQTCVGVERIYVDRAVSAEFVQALTRRLQTVRSGSDPGSAYGPMTVSAQADIVRRHVVDAMSHGADTPLGGVERIRGRYIDPILLVDGDESSKAVQEETFGPSVTVRTVDSADEAIALANASQFGLGAAVFSRAHAQEIAAKLSCGMVSINSVIAFVSIPSLPFGGVRNSGYGRIHGAEGLREFSLTKSIARKRFSIPGMNAMRLDRPAITMRILRMVTTIRFSRRLRWMR